MRNVHRDRSIASCLHRLDRLTAFLCAVTLLPHLAGCRDGSSDEVLWVGRLGSDTVVVEGARQVGSRIDGTIVNVAAGLLVQRYEVDLDANDNVRALRSWPIPDMSAPRLAEAPPSISVEFGPDSIHVTRLGPDGPQTTAVPAVEGAVPIFDPFFNNPMSLMELALRSAKSRGDGMVRLYYLGSAGVQELPLGETDPGEVSYPYVLARQYPMMAGTRLYASMDGMRLVRFDARETTFKIVTDRNIWADPLVLGRQFEERGLGAGGMSGMSPPTRAAGRVGTVDVAITYGQPRRRGRNIFPDVVPFDQIWRAGANAATEISFSGSVVLGGRPVPAGSYSVWVIPGERADTLILNEATRIWGTMYDSEQDFLRVPMRRQLVEEPIEDLTYAIKSGSDAGRLELAWGDRRLEITLAPAP